MPMSDGRNNLKKIAFEVGDKMYRFAINPEEMKDDRPHRASTIKTKSRIIINDFGSDVWSFSISGTTGFRNGKGIQKIKEMKKYIEDYADSGGNGRLGHNEFYFHNFTNDESFVVHLAPQGVQYSQSADSPLMYRYTINFNVLRYAGEPASEDVVTPDIGNPYPSVGNGGTPPSLSDPYPSGGLPNIPDGMTREEIGGHRAAGGIPDSSTSTPAEDTYNDYSSATESGTSLSYGKNVVDIYGEVSIDSETRNKQQTVNPQVRGEGVYSHGTTALGYIIGYYGG